jgi:hypothetical protein
MSNYQNGVFYPKFIPNSIWDKLPRTSIMLSKEESQWTYSSATNIV